MDSAQNARANGAIARLIAARILSSAEGGDLLVLVDLASRPDRRHAQAAAVAGYVPERVGSVFLESRRELCVAMGMGAPASPGTGTLKSRLERWAALGLVSDHGGVVFVRVGGLVRVDPHRAAHETDDAIADGQPWPAAGHIPEVKRWKAQAASDRAQLDLRLGRSLSDQGLIANRSPDYIQGAYTHPPVGPPVGGAPSPWDSGLAPTWAEAFCWAMIPPSPTRGVRLDELARYQLARLVAMHGEETVVETIFAKGGTHTRPVRLLQTVLSAPRTGQRRSPERRRNSRRARLEQRLGVGELQHEPQTPPQPVPTPEADPAAAAVWRERSRALRDRMSASSWATWLACCVAVALDGDVVQLDAGRAYDNWCIDERYGAELAAAGARMVELDFDRIDVPPPEALPTIDPPADPPPVRARASAESIARLAAAAEELAA